MLFRNLFFILFLLIISSCVQREVKPSYLSLGRTSSGVLVSSVQINNNQFIINGTNLKRVNSVTLKNTGTKAEENFEIETKSDNQIILNGLQNLTLASNILFDLILSTADAASTFTVNFTVGNGTITSAMLSSMGATSGQVLKFNGSNWVPAAQNETQTFISTWNASTNSPDLSVVSSNPGDYYIVTVAGVYNSTTYAVGDWIISDGFSWQKVPVANTSVTSFQGRKGIVTLTPTDYVSLKDPTTLKITGSKLQDIADIDVTSIANGQILKWNSSSSKWIAATENAAGISLTDLSATAPLAYNNSTGVFTLPTANVLALPLTGLATVSGALVATDSILAGFGKLKNLPDDYVSKTSGATITTGTIALSGTAMITIPTATGTTLTEATNVTYVTNAIAANGVWNKSSSTINYVAGNVGIGTTIPTSTLTLKNSNSTASLFSIYNSSSTKILDFSSDTNYGELKLNTASGDEKVSFHSWYNEGPGIFIDAKTTSISDGSTNGYGAAIQIFVPQVLGSENGIVFSDGLTSSYSTVSGAAITHYVTDTSGYGRGGLKFKTTDSGSITTRMIIDPTGKVGIGTTAPTNQLTVAGDALISNLTIGKGGSSISTNTAIGNQALLSNTYGNNSTSIGYNALYANISGNNNTAIGSTALLSNTSGNYNFAGGYSTLASNNTGSGNTAIGHLSLYSNHGKNESTAIGYYAMAYADSTTSSSSTYNTAIGAYALQGSATPSANTGTANTSIGHSTMQSNTSGSNNVALGYSALNGNTTGSNNIGIGRFALSSVSTKSNNIAIGNDAGKYLPNSVENAVIIGGNYGTSVTDGQISISNGSGTERIRIDNNGNMGLGTTSPSYKLDVTGDINISSGNVFRINGSSICSSSGCTSSSDRKLKEKIKPLINSFENILKLQGVAYDWIDKKKFGFRHQIGFIAQDVEKIFPEVVLTDEKSGLKSIAYDHLISPLIEAFKELNNKFIGLVSEVKKLGNRVVGLEEKDKVTNRKISSLEAENKMLRDYLCSKDPKANFCLNNKRGESLK